MGPCFQRPGFEKDGMLGQRAETFGRQVFFSSACNSPAYLLGADVFCVDMDCPHNHVFLILEPMAGSGPGSSQPPLRMTPKRHLCGHPAAQQAHSVAHPLPPHREAKTIAFKQKVRNATAAMETRAHNNKGQHSRMSQKNANREISNIPVCRKKT